MPTYEYACASCAHEWEFEQSIKDASLTKCPSCGNDTARRQISRGTGFILKGGGWYSDLYSSSSNKPPAKADSGTTSTGSESAGTTSAGTTSAGTTSAGSESKSSESGSASKSDGGGGKSDAGTSSTTAAA
jgi:putative FmdB family regulatory protein